MTTLAFRIRAEAIMRGYWELDASEQPAERRSIARQLGCKTEAVTVALKRVGRSVGRPRNPELPRCSHCGQALPASQGVPPLVQIAEFPVRGYAFSSSPSGRKVDAPPQVPTPQSANQE